MLCNASNVRNYSLASLQNVDLLSNTYLVISNQKAEIKGSGFTVPVDCICQL